MKTKNYREHLEKALAFLSLAEDTLYEQVVNLAFSGIYSEIAEVHENNEIKEMDPAYFEDTDDANVEMLMNLVKRLKLTREKIIDINAIE